jgi:membrane associated rhomboid family serine protease
MKALRKLILGETWALPVGVFATLVVGLVLDALEGDDAWWQHAGGFVLLALVVVALTVALPRRR